MADYRLPFTGEQVEQILSTATPQSLLTQETQRATEAEGQLQSNINTEAETRGNADLQLQQNINTETETRGQADLALQQLIQQVQASLINYYLKTETYSATQIDAMLAAIKQFRYQVVDVLPTPSAETMGIIYLVPSAHAVSGNIKDEYITLTRDEGSGTIYYFEQIGETAIDLSNYYTKAQTNAEITAAINAALAAYYTSTQTDAAIAAAIATAIANYYTKSQVDALIANFITASVNNLVNYYLKSETFTKAEVNQLIAAVQQFTYQSVAELPTASADTMNKIYLVPSTNPETKNVKDEYITIATTDQGTTTYSWEQIGSTTVDLSGYYTSAQTDAAITAAINTALADYSTTTQMTAAIAAAIANYYTKAEVDALIANFITKAVNDLTYYYLKTETYSKAEVDALVAAIQQFRLIAVNTLPTASAETLNKIYLVPSSNPQTQNVKDEYITLVVEEQGTTTYSWECIGSTEVNLTNYYTKSQTDSAITAAINAALADYSTTSQVSTIISTAITTALTNYYTKTQVDNIAGTKTDKLTMTGAGAAVEDDLVAIDSNGNIKDSGKKPNDFQATLVVGTNLDSTPTANSNHRVTSGGVKTALDGKQAIINDRATIGDGYAVCSTAGDTQQKEVSITNFLLVKYGVVSVKFANAITVASPTLKINDIAAKAIYLDGAAVQPGWILAGMTANMRYNGAQFDIISIMGPDKTDDELLVDMGLPSGLLWATRNIDVKQANGFAKNIYQYECSFFSWGNTDGHNPTAINSFAPYSWGNANTSEPYASSPGAALTASFGLSFDAVFANLGNQWRMPTTEEFAELFANIDFINPDGTVIETTQANKLVTVNGVVGILLKSKNNSRTLFFPCSGLGSGQSWDYRGSYGYYWSSSLYSATHGRNLGFYSGGVYPQYLNYRFYGFSVRPVQNLLSPAQ